MNEYMNKRMGIGMPVDMEKFVDTRFADNACKHHITQNKPAFLRDSGDDILRILNRGEACGAKTVSSKAMLNLEGKYLTFKLGDQEFGIDIMKIKEIIGMLPVRSIPQSPDYIKGVINSRGSVIPVLDLKRRFGMGDMVENNRNCIVVLDHEMEDRHVKIGVAVDAVSEVLAIKSSHIETVSVLGSMFDSRHILAMAKFEKKVKLLLDMDYILGQSEVGEIAA
jgi:chemotaxis signal transduction protein